MVNGYFTEAQVRDLLHNTRIALRPVYGSGSSDDTVARVTEALNAHILREKFRERFDGVTITISGNGSKSTIGALIRDELTEAGFHAASHRFESDREIHFDLPGGTKHKFRIVETA